MSESIKELVTQMTDKQLFAVWFLIGAALVFWMQAGFAMVEAGFTRAKNTGNIIMKNLMDFCIGTVTFILIGFGLLMGEDLIGFIGKPGFDLFTSYQNFDFSSFVFNLVFCATTATIVSGAMAERTKFLSYCVYSGVISAVIYPIEAHWIWGNGWLSQLGFHDFAGSCAIHMVGGISALIGASILGARIGKFKRDKNGKVTKAPKGGKKSFEVIIPGDGIGDHPSYTVLTMAKEAFESIGIEFIINDPADSNELWSALDAGTQELWCAAWGSTIDPDMYQVYHGNNIVGRGGTDSNHYHIDDEKLNELIMKARVSTDQSFRKKTYKKCLNIIADWAVEIPAYQRHDAFLFSTERINISTLTPDITTSWGWMNDIEKLEMNPVIIKTQPGTR